MHIAAVTALDFIPPYYIYLCVNDSKTNDEKIAIVPVNPENMECTDFKITYKSGTEGVYRFICKRDLLIPYVRTVLTSATIDTSVTRFRYIQSLPPNAPGTMVSVPMPDNASDLNPFIDIVNAQLQILCTSATWPKMC